MRLVTAHKILITAAIAMFALLAVWYVRQGAAFPGAVISGAAAGVLAVYWRYRFRRDRGKS